MLELLDFYADWCGPCKIMTPILEDIEKELSGRVRFQKIDVDKEQTKATQYSILSIPTLVVLKNGKEVDRIIGVAPKKAIKTKILSYLN